MTHTIHAALPSGFTFANELQSEAFAATGSVNGASKVALVSTPAGTDLAIRMRPPRTLEDIASVLGRGCVTTSEEYRSEYEKGWRRAAGPADMGGGSHAHDDGYLDRAAGRSKWHLSWCLDHDECGEG